MGRERLLRVGAFARSLALAIAAGLALYCLLSSIAGPAGALAYKELQERKADMERNLVSLAAANEKLRSELDSLRSDADRIAREARALGYLRANETEIVLEGWKAPSGKLETGKVLPFSEAATLPDEVIKEIALGAALATLAAFLAPKRGAKGSRRRQGRPGVEST